MKFLWHTGILLFIFPALLMAAVNLQPSSLQDAEIRLQHLFAAIKVSNTDEQNITIADSIQTELEAALHLNDAFEYPFDSLKSLGKTYAPDRQIRIFTWNLFQKNGTHRFYGFLLTKPTKNNSPVYNLTDISWQVNDPATAIIDSGKWFGCLVYEIIPFNISGETHYALLGFHPQNLFVNQKIIDVLWFRHGQPVFGKPVFRYQHNLQSRILFQYGARVQMSLKWNESMKMIVFDHLSPSRPSLTGNYEHYGPDFSYDGFRLENDAWILSENIDVRNEAAGGTRDKKKGPRDK